MPSENPVASWCLQNRIGAPVFVFTSFRRVAGETSKLHAMVLLVWLQFGLGKRKTLCLGFHKREQPCGSVATGLWVVTLSFNDIEKGKLKPFWWGKNRAGRFGVDTLHVFDPGEIGPSAMNGGPGLGLLLGLQLCVGPHRAVAGYQLLCASTVWTCLDMSGLL